MQRPSQTMRTVGVWADLLVGSWRNTWVNEPHAPDFLALSMYWKITHHPTQHDRTAMTLRFVTIPGAVLMGVALVPLVRSTPIDIQNQ